MLKAQERTWSGLDQSTMGSRCSLRALPWKLAAASANCFSLVSLCIHAAASIMCAGASLVLYSGVTPGWLSQYSVPCCTGVIIHS